MNKFYENESENSVVLHFDKTSNNFSAPKTDENGSKNEENLDMFNFPIENNVEPFVINKQKTIEPSIDHFDTYFKNDLRLLKRIKKLKKAKRESIDVFCEENEK